MSINLIDMVKNHFTADYVNKEASRLGESNSGILKALSAIIPTSLAGIFHKSTASTEGANSVFNMAKEAATTPMISPQFKSISTVQPSGDGNILSYLFGSNQKSITKSVAQMAGIKEDSVSSAMTSAVPQMMGVIGKHAEQNNMTATGLSSFLSSQKENIMNAMPSGLSSITGMFGLSSATTAIASGMSSARETFSTHRERVEHKAGGARWVLPLILILGAAALVWYFVNNYNKRQAETAKTTVVVPEPSSIATSIVPPARATVKVKLPNGKELNAFKGGIEDQLVAFLNTNWRASSEDALKNKWFDFDNLNFNTGKATLLPESESQLDNIAAILKAFPNAKIKIGGYTDASGNAAVNKRLSQDRANAAMNGLKKRGVGAQLVGAEGYGSQFAKYPATASEQQRALDRHVSISVRK